MKKVSELNERVSVLESIVLMLEHFKQVVTTSSAKTELYNEVYELLTYKLKHEQSSYEKALNEEKQLKEAFKCKKRKERYEVLLENALKEKQDLKTALVEFEGDGELLLALEEVEEQIKEYQNMLSALGSEG